MNSGLAKLTEKPETDPTDGQADVIANNLIGQFEDLTALARQINAFLGDGEEKVQVDNPDDAVKALRLVIMAAKAVARILRTAKVLAPSVRFLDLGVLGDLKAVQDECGLAFFAAIRAMRSLDFDKLERVMDNIGNYEDPELETLVSEWDDDDVSVLSDDTGLGTKRSGRTADKSVSSGSTMSKGSPPGSRLGVSPKQGRVNTMFRYMFGAAEDLRDAGVSMSLDRPPPGGKGTMRPRVRGRRPEVPQEVEDEDMTQAMNRGQRMAEQEEEEFQMREQGLALLTEDVERDKAQEAADNALFAQLNRRRETDLKPFKRFGVKAYDDLVNLLDQRFKDATTLLYVAYTNFNAYRQQKVLPARAADADVGNAIKTGAGMYGGFDMIQGSVSRMGGKVYKVGGSSDILYEREGLPRFL
jgi:hypothetical protein